MLSSASWASKLIAVPGVLSAQPPNWAPDGSPPRPRLRRRAAGFAALLVLLLVGGGGAWLGASRADHRRPPPPPVGSLLFRTGPRALARVSLGPLERTGAIETRRLAEAVRRAIPAGAIVNRGAARIAYRYDRAYAVSRAARAPRTGATIEVPARAVSAAIRAPVIAQKLPNDCEATALQILLATTGVAVDQSRLQAQMPRSGPLDPVGSGALRTWGDPDQGFVGRPEGGGPAGGFGVYPRPVAALASRHARQLQDLTGTTPASVYRRLLEGHAVMAWIALSHGPYDHWRTPAGRTIQANFGEHTIVLTGIRHDGNLTIINPLNGTRETWTQKDFAARWTELGRRALTT